MRSVIYRNDSPAGVRWSANTPPATSTAKTPISRERQYLRCLAVTIHNFSIALVLQKCNSVSVETPTAPTMTRPMARMETRLGRPLADELDALYHGEGLTLAEVAQRLGVSITTVLRWMDRLGIETRFPGQRAKPAEQVA